MNPGQEFDGGGAGQGAFAVHLVNGALNDDMSARLKGEGAGFFFKLSADKRPFDVARSRVVALDQVRVLAVHHADEIRKLGCAIRVQPQSQSSGLPLNVDRKVCQFCGNILLKEAGFYSGGRFQHSCRSSIKVSSW